MLFLCGGRASMEVKMVGHTSGWKTSTRGLGRFLATISTNTNLEGMSLSNTFDPGDVLFGKLRPYLAKVWVAEFAGRSTTECLVMKPVEGRTTLSRVRLR